MFWFAIHLREQLPHVSIIPLDCYAPVVWSIMQMVLHVTRILACGNNAPSCCLDSPKLWNAILAKSPDHILNSPDILWKVEILLWTIQIYYERFWFYYEQFRYIMKGQNFLMNGPDTLWKVEISLWTIQVCYEKPRLYYISLFQRQPFKIGVLRNFSIFTGKHLCWILKSVKKNSSTCIILWILRRF